jgi:hypothetical protein
VNGTISWNTTTNNDALHHFQAVGGIAISALIASNIQIANNVSGNTGSVTTQPYGIQIIDGQDLNSTTLLIAQNNALTGNSAAAIYDPAGTYGSIPGANMPVMSYTVPINDAPVLGGISAAVSTTSAAAVRPFTAESITASDMGVTETVTVTLSRGDANGTLSGSGITETSTPGTYAIGAAGITPAAATALLRGAVFTPAAGAGPIGSTIATTLTITDVQTSPTSAATVSSNAAVTVTYKVVALPISAKPATASAATTDETSAPPFSGVVITDPNPAQTETAVVTLSNAANGTLYDSNEAADGGVFSNGSYILNGSATAVAAALDNLQFRPTAHQVAPGLTVNTSVTATITDSAGQNSVISSTVSATAANDAPVIGGALSAESASGTTPITPFAAATISSPDTAVQDSLIIALVNSTGALSDANGTLSGTGLTKITTGVYSIAAAAPATLTAEMQALRFTPAQNITPQSAQTTFVLAATQNGLTSYNNAVSVTASAATTKSLFDVGPNDETAQIHEGNTQIVSKSMLFLRPAINDPIAVKGGEILTGASAAGFLDQAAPPGMTFRASLAAFGSDITNFGATDPIDIVNLKNVSATKLNGGPADGLLHLAYEHSSTHFSISGRHWSLPPYV